jgi:hypothetical protein
MSVDQTDLLRPQFDKIRRMKEFGKPGPETLLMSNQAAFACETLSGLASCIVRRDIRGAATCEESMTASIAEPANRGERGEAAVRHYIPDTSRFTEPWSRAVRLPD